MVAFFLEQWIFLSILNRALMALFTSFLLVWTLGPRFIRWAHGRGHQPIRLDGPEQHLIDKQKTPTLGGILILGSMVLSSLAWSKGLSVVYLSLGTAVAMGILGFRDDLVKLHFRQANGLSAKKKFLWQSLISTGFVMALYVTQHGVSRSIFLPLIGYWIPIGIFYGVWALVVLVGTTNAVNLTDGLDGLASGVLLPCVMVLGVLAVTQDSASLAHNNGLPYVSGSSALLVPCGACIGALSGFLWYNAPPAKIMMGDVGSMGLGGFLGSVAFILHQELLLSVVGGIFVAESLSVMVQILVFKKTKKRLFLMAPLHHHFEKKSWKEPTIVLRFWIVSWLLAFTGLWISYKL